MFAFLQAILRAVMRICFRVTVEGIGDFPLSGPVVVCSNHTFMKDLPLIGCFAPRKIRWIAKAELFRFAPFGALISGLGAFPVKRGEHDRDAVKTVYELLRAGEPLGIFPEGTRVTDPMKRKPIRRSFVSFAVNAGCGILPVAVRYEGGPFGRGRLFCKVRIHFGELWTPEPGRKYARAELDALADTVMSGIYEKVQSPKKAKEE